MAKTQVTQVEASKIGRDKGGRWIFSLPPRGFMRQVREDILFYTDPQDKGWERPRWENLFYFFRQPMVTWPNGLNVLGCLGDRGEWEWKERGGTRLLSVLQHSPYYHSILFGILLSSPNICGNVQRDRENPFCINQYGECERENKGFPSGKKKKKLDFWNRTAKRKIPGGQKLSNKL